MPERLFAGSETLAAALFALRSVDLNDVTINAAPAEIFAVPERFFLSRITLTLVFAALLRRSLNDLPVYTAPTRRRRCWGWRRTMDRRWTWKRQPPARRIFRRTWWMRSGRAVPFVAAATFFPPPAAAVLDPNPLATLIMPLPSGDTLRCEPEGVLVAVLRNSVTDNDAGIADRTRDCQHFEIALGKIAQRVQIVHFVLDEKEGVLGVVGCS